MPEHGLVDRGQHGIGELVERLDGDGAALLLCCLKIPRLFARCVVVVAVEVAPGQGRGGDESLWAGNEELREDGARGQDAAGGREEDDVDEA